MGVLSSSPRRKKLDQSVHPHPTTYLVCEVIPSVLRLPRTGTWLQTLLPLALFFRVYVPCARSPDIHACLARVAEIRWKRCIPGSELGIARLRETIMLQMMYLRMTDTKSVAREGESVYPLTAILFWRICRAGDAAGEGIYRRKHIV